MQAKIHQSFGNALQSARNRNVLNEPQQAFENALKSGRLTQDNVHKYMYMGTENGTDQFKNKLTREYITN